MPNLIAKMFGTRNERILKSLIPYVESINKEFEKLKKLSEEDFP